MKSFKDLLEIVLGEKIDTITYDENGIHLVIPHTSYKTLETMREKLKSFVFEKKNTSKKKNRKRIYVDFVPEEGELWKNVPQCNGFKASNKGRIMEGNKILLPYVDKKGYLRISIKENGKHRKYKAVHHVIAETFIENPLQKPEVDHINTIRDDNRVENLRWVTHFENLFANPLTEERLKQYPGLYIKELRKAFEKEKNV